MNQALLGFLSLVLVACNGKVTVSPDAGADSGSTGGGTTASTTTTSSTATTTGTGGSNEGGGGSSVTTGAGGTGGGSTCELVKLGEFDISDASQMHFACSPKAATCVLSLIENGKPSQRLFLMNGEEDPAPSWAQATNTNNPVSFVLGTPDGFMASVWEQNGNASTNWLLRTDDLGAVQQAEETPIGISGSAQIGTSGWDGEWVANGTWMPPGFPGEGATYQFGKVDAQGNVPTADAFQVPGAYAIWLNGLARVGDVTGLAASWFGTDGFGHLNLYLKPDFAAVLSVELAPPAGSVNPNFTPIDAVYQVMGAHEVNGEFLVAWRNNLTNEAWATKVSAAGLITSTVALSNSTTDLVPIKGGYATAEGDYVAGATFLDLLDLDFQTIDFAGFWWSVGASQILEGPFVATDGLDDGRFALMWIDSDNIAHVIFLGYEGC